MSTLKLSGIQCRGAAIQPATIDPEKRTVTLLFSTGAAVKRWTWDGVPYIEELAMGDSNIRLARFNAGASLLDSHGSWSLRSVLGVTEKAWLSNGEAYVNARFSERPEVDPIWRDVQAGIIRSVSVGYTVHATKRGLRDGMTLLTHTDWEPTEVSLVAIPADPSASVRAQGSGPVDVEVTEDAAEELVTDSFSQRNAARVRLVQRLL